jgi:transcriptional regulator with XRE-family HTH domain
MAQRKRTTVTARQIKAARALLGWTQSELSMAAGVSLPAIGKRETDDGELGGREATRSKLVAALRKAGVTFLDAGALGVGVVVRKRK